MLKTAEFVTPKHPDKICDRISDAILDGYLKKDPDARVAVETAGGHGIVSVTGEVTSKANIDIRKIVQRVLGEYKAGIQINISQQSPEISRGVNKGGAGDQGIMVGYACRDNEEMMPQEYYLARSLCKYIYKYHPVDGKTQITINDIDNSIVNIVASFQNVSSSKLKTIVERWLKDKEKNPYLKKYYNFAGDWKMGGFEADAGVTGRKIVVDAYGPGVEVGGGAYSGKDPSKVDRSGAYMARRIAVDILRKNEFKEIKVKLAYCIGKADPVMLSCEVFNDIKWANIDYYPSFSLSQSAIIKRLKLKKPIYERTACWGAYGNGFNWDK